MKWWWILGSLAAAAVIVSLVIFQRTSLALTPLVRNEPFEVKVQFPEGWPEVGKTKHVHVLVSREGQPFDVYQNRYALHLIVANADFTSFFHTVELQEDEAGVYGAEVPFGPAGQYRVWVEVNDATAEQKHGEAAPLIAFTDFSVPAGTASLTPMPLVRGQEASVGPYTVTLKHGRFVAGQESTWQVQVKNAAGQVQTLLDPEPAIAVMLGPREDSEFSFFRHGHAHPAIQGTTIQYTETFPVPGEYLFWIEIYLREGQNLAKLQVPFVLKVSE